MELLGCIAYVNKHGHIKIRDERDNCYVYIRKWNKGARGNARRKVIGYEQCKLDARNQY